MNWHDTRLFISLPSAPGPQHWVGMSRMFVLTRLGSVRPQLFRRVEKTELCIRERPSLSMHTRSGSWGPGPHTKLWRNFSFVFLCTFVQKRSCSWGCLSLPFTTDPALLTQDSSDGLEPQRRRHLTVPPALASTLRCSMEAQTLNSVRADTNPITSKAHLVGAFPVLRFVGPHMSGSVETEKRRHTQQ